MTSATRTAATARVTKIKVCSVHTRANRASDNGTRPSVSKILNTVQIALLVLSFFLPVDHLVRIVTVVKLLVSLLQ